MPYSSVSGVCSSLFNSSIHPALCSASSKLNNEVFKISFGSILPKLDSRIFAEGFSLCIVAFNTPRCDLFIKSVLLSMITFANSI